MERFFARVVTGGTGVNGLIFYYCLGISDEGNSVPWTENVMNVFNGVTSPLVFSYS